VGEHVAADVGRDPVAERDHQIGPCGARAGEHGRHVAQDRAVDLLGEATLSEAEADTYARRYADLVERVRKVESDRLQSTRVTEAVARYYFKLLAYKDEYEVGRLHSDPAFRAKIAAQFDGDYKLNFYLAPPIISKPDPASGKIAKKRFGPWMMTAFAALSKLRFLRGSAFDVFGYTQERRTERALIGEYESTVEEILSRLSADNHDVAVQLASVPDDIRGYGHIKEGNLKVARIKWDDLLARLRVNVPTKLSKAEREAIENLQKISRDDPREKVFS